MVEKAGRYICFRGFFVMEKLGHIARADVIRSEILVYSGVGWGNPVDLAL